MGLLLAEVVAGLCAGSFEGRSVECEERNFDARADLVFGIGVDGLAARQSDELDQVPEFAADGFEDWRVDVLPERIGEDFLDEFHTLVDHGDGVHLSKRTGDCFNVFSKAFEVGRGLKKCELSAMNQQVEALGFGIVVLVVS
jgi:hypothetical protein